MQGLVPKIAEPMQVPVRKDLAMSAEEDSDSGLSEPEMEPRGFDRQDTPLSTGGFMRQLSDLSTGGLSRQETEQCWPTWQGSCDPGLAFDMTMAGIPWPSPWLSDALTLNDYAKSIDFVHHTNGLSSDAKVFEPAAFADKDPKLELALDPTADAQQKRSTRKKRRKAKSLIDQAAKQKVPAPVPTSTVNEQPSEVPSQTQASTTDTATVDVDGQPHFCPFCGGKCEPHFKFCRFCGSPQSNPQFGAR
jgi:hypothetical protein